MKVIGLVGNPNCGKSALFNALTGIRQTTGNWPGVTVEKKEGYFSNHDSQYTVVDLPGIYSLDAQSLDEEVTREFILSEQAQLIINVVDASNLERNLYLSAQLHETGVPIIVALNMVDVAQKRGIEIDCDALSDELKCPVVPIVAVKNKGLSRLKETIQAYEKNNETKQIVHSDLIEQSLQSLRTLVQLENVSRFKLLAVLESGCISGLSLQEADQTKVQNHLNVMREGIRKRTGEDVDTHIADARFSHAHKLANSVIRSDEQDRKTASDKIDEWVLSRWLGIPIFMLVMYLMFMFTINIGGAFIDFFDIAVGALLIDWPLSIMNQWGVPEALAVVLAKGIGGGIQVVSTFIPVITFLYLFLSFLEYSGYMARAAFVMDKAMQKIGLPGKAFVPMIVGFGCNVPAVMATRTLENERERKLTILMNPFMSCGARLPVYVLFAAAFFPENGQNLVFALYLAGVAVAVLTGLVMRKSLLKGDSSGFLMELPAYHMPTVKGVLLRTWDRVKIFIRDAGKVIVVMVLILNVLNSIGQDGSFGNEDSEESVLSVLGKSLTPIFSPMGIEEGNWPATVGIFTGVMAKEAVVGTLDSLYGNLAQNDQAEEEVFSLQVSLHEAFLSISDNLSGLGDALFDPLGLSVEEVSSLSEAAEAQEVEKGTFSEMIARFNGQAGAFAYLLFILLYFPCVATIGAVVRETSRSWAGFVALWSTGSAYIISSIFYQVSSFSQHPVNSLLWCALFTFIVCMAFWLLRIWGNKVQNDENSFGVVEVSA